MKKDINKNDIEGLFVEDRGLKVRHLTVLDGGINWAGNKKKKAPKKKTTKKITKRKV